MLACHHARLWSKDEKFTHFVVTKERQTENERAKEGKVVEYSMKQLTDMFGDAGAKTYVNLQHFSKHMLDKRATPHISSNNDVCVCMRVYLRCQATNARKLGRSRICPLSEVELFARLEVTEWNLTRDTRTTVNMTIKHAKCMSALVETHVQ